MDANKLVSSTSPAYAWQSSPNVGANLAADSRLRDYTATHEKVCGNLRIALTCAKDAKRPAPHRAMRKGDFDAIVAHSLLLLMFITVFYPSRATGDKNKCWRRGGILLRSERSESKGVSLRSDW
jgi:hypothetical protein